jgi:hypothetical protein
MAADVYKNEIILGTGGGDNGTLGLVSAFSMVRWLWPTHPTAPALTGPGFGRSHLNASQLRSVVTPTMPLTAPGSLKPDDYAAVMAFLLRYDCVQPSGGGQQPFPTTDLPSLQQVELGSATCAPKK